MGRKKKMLYRCRDASYDGCPDDVEVEGSQCKACKEYWSDMVRWRKTEIVEKYNVWLKENGLEVLDSRKEDDVE